MGDSDSSTLENSAAVALTGKIMVISIIVLFVVVVFVVLLHVYAKWFWWRIEEEEEEDNSTRPQQRRRRGRRFVFAPGQQQLTAAAARKGLDPTVLKSLPVEVYQAKNFEEGLECAVCLCELEEGEKARLLPKCKHGFHLECIDMWFESHATCPICRNPVDNFDGVGEHELTESLNLPTNVLFWGDENEVNSRINDAAASSSSSMDEHEGAAASSSSSSMAAIANDSMLVIDIPRQVLEEMPSELKSPPCSSPMAKRLRSLRRLLSGADRKASPSSQSNCADVDDML